MPIGQLTERLTIERDVVSSDGMGGYSTSAEIVAEVWASVIRLRGREQSVGNQIQAEQSYRITIRYLDGLDPSMNLLWRGKRMNIRSIINPDRKQRYLELECVAGVAT